MRIISLILFMLVAAANILLQDRQNINTIKYKKITKFLLMPSLFLFYISSDKSVDFIIILALAFGWMGDIFLMQDKLVKKGEILVEEVDDKYILLGMVSFLIGHLFYSTSFILKVSDFKAIPFEIYSLLVVFIFFAAFMFNVTRPTGIMKIGVPVYSVILTMMGYSTLLLMYDNYNLSTVMMFIGALIFISSDSILSLSLIKKMERVPNSYVMKSYISAQFIIILGLLMY